MEYLAFNFCHMSPNNAIQIIKSKFERVDSSIQIPLMKKQKHFTAILREIQNEVLCSTGKSTSRQ